MAKATRAAFGETLVELVDEGMDIMAVDADLAGSTTTAKLGKAYPDRLVDVGIAEQNMIGVASGLALTGRTVFTGSFAVFGAGRCWEQIRNTVVHLAPRTSRSARRTPASPWAPTARPIRRSRTSPSCARSPACACSFRPTSTPPRRRSASRPRPPGPFYVRMGREPLPEVYEEGFSRSSEGFASVLREGTDISVMACGVEVAHALEAADKLAEAGISAEVVDIMSVKPLGEDVIVALCRQDRLRPDRRGAQRVRRHGFGCRRAAVREAPGPCEPSRDDQLRRVRQRRRAARQFGLDADGIVARVHEVLGR